MSTVGAHIGKNYCKSKSTIEMNIQQFMKKFNIPNLYTVQIFVATPAAWHFSVKENQIASLKQFIKTSGIHIYVHARYLDNIFSSAVKDSTLAFVKKELKICSNIGAKGFVVHLYKYPPKSVVKSLKKLKPPKNVKIMLETPAINPSNALYNSAANIINIWNLTKKAGINTGIVIDTCHIYATGLNISDLNTMKEFFCEIIKCIPVCNLLIHLNDSAANLGSGKDRHASLGEGLIWKNNKDSLTWLLEFIQQYKIAGILERNSGNGDLTKDFALIKKLT